MAETREERQSMIVALKKEIASAEAALKSFKGQLADFEGVPGREAHVLKLSLAVREQERSIKRAGEELSLRVGGPPARRGPGRPAKAAGSLTPNEARASAGFTPEPPAASSEKLPEPPVKPSK